MRFNFFCFIECQRLQMRDRFFRIVANHPKGSYAVRAPLACEWLLLCGCSHYRPKGAFFGALARFLRLVIQAHKQIDGWGVAALRFGVSPIAAANGIDGNFLLFYVQRLFEQNIEFAGQSRADIFNFRLRTAKVTDKKRCEARLEACRQIAVLQKRIFQ